MFSKGNQNERVVEVVASTLHKAPDADHERDRAGRHHRAKAEEHERILRNIAKIVFRGLQDLENPPGDGNGMAVAVTSLNDEFPAHQKAFLPVHLPVCHS